MEDKVLKKLAQLQSIAKTSVATQGGTQSSATPDSLSSVIRTKRDADLFFAQLSSVIRFAREEYLESKGKEISRL